MKKNYIKATIYSIGGFIIMILSMLGIEFMFFSGSFLPVYVKGTYVIGNQVLRWEIYLALLMMIIAGLKVCTYGIDFFIKKLRKNKRRR